MKSSLKKDQLVWVRLSGYPWWPGQVVELKPKEDQVTVKFLNKRIQHAMVPYKDVVEYSERPKNSRHKTARQLPSVIRSADRIHQGLSTFEDEIVVLQNPAASRARTICESSKHQNTTPSKDGPSIQISTSPARRKSSLVSQQQNNNQNQNQSSNHMPFQRDYLSRNSLREMGLKGSNKMNLILNQELQQQQSNGKQQQSFKESLNEIEQKEDKQRLIRQKILQNCKRMSLDNSSIFSQPRRKNSVTQQNSTTNKEKDKETQKEKEILKESYKETYKEIQQDIQQEAQKEDMKQSKDKVKASVQDQKQDHKQDQKQENKKDLRQLEETVQKDQGEKPVEEKIVKTIAPTPIRAPQCFRAVPKLYTKQRRSNKHGLNKVHQQYHQQRQQSQQQYQLELREVNELDQSDINRQVREDKGCNRKMNAREEHSMKVQVNKGFEALNQKFDDINSRLQKKKLQDLTDQKATRSKTRLTESNYPVEQNEIEQFPNLHSRIKELQSKHINLRKPFKLTELQAHRSLNSPQGSSRDLSNEFSRQNSEDNSYQQNSYQGNRNKGHQVTGVRSNKYNLQKQRQIHSRNLNQNQNNQNNQNSYKSSSTYRHSIGNQQQQQQYQQKYGHNINKGTQHQNQNQKQREHKKNFKNDRPNLVQTRQKNKGPMFGNLHNLQNLQKNSLNMDGQISDIGNEMERLQETKEELREYMDYFFENLVKHARENKQPKATFFRELLVFVQNCQQLPIGVKIIQETHIGTFLDKSLELLNQMRCYEIEEYDLLLPSLSDLVKKLKEKMDLNYTKGTQAPECQYLDKATKGKNLEEQISFLIHHNQDADKDQIFLNQQAIWNSAHFSQNSQNSLNSQNLNQNQNMGQNQSITINLEDQKNPQSSSTYGGGQINLNQNQNLNQVSKKMIDLREPLLMSRVKQEETTEMSQRRKQVCRKIRQFLESKFGVQRQHSKNLTLNIEKNICSIEDSNSNGYTFLCHRLFSYFDKQNYRQEQLLPFLGMNQFQFRKKLEDFGLIEVLRQDKNQEMALQFAKDNEGFAPSLEQIRQASNALNSQEGNKVQQILNSQMSVSMQSVSSRALDD